MASSARPGNRTAVALRGVMAIVIAVAANSFLLTALLLSGAVEPFEPLSYPSVVSLTALGVGGATVVYWLVARWKATPDTWFLAVALVVLVISFIPAIGWFLTDPAGSLDGVVVLMSMHVVAAVVAIAVLTDLGR